MVLFLEISRLGFAWARGARWLGVVALVTTAALAAARDEWRTVRTENFEIFSSVSEKKTKQLAIELEQFRASFVATFRLRPAHEPRVTVMLFDTERRFRPYMPLYKGKPKEVAGYFIGGLDEAVIALNMDGNEDDESSPAEIIFHEYVHFLLHSRGMKLPTWLNEGLAELFSTFQVTGSTVEYGRPKQLYVDVLNQSSLMPMKELMAIDERSPDYNEEHRAGMFYAQAWALTHFLVCSEDRTNAAKLGRFLAMTDAAAEGAEVSFKEVFGPGFDKLEFNLRTYLQGGRYYKRTAPAPLKDFGTNLAIRTATAQERDLALMNLRWRVQRLPETRQAAVQYAQANPAAFRAQEILAIVEASSGSFTAALGHWRRAAELGSLNPFVLVQAARAKMMGFAGTATGDLDARLTEAEASQLRFWLDRVVRNNPRFDDGWTVLAQVESHAPELRLGVVNDLQNHVDQMKDRNPLLLGLAMIRWRVKDRATADSIVKAVLESSIAKPEIKAVARMLQGHFSGSKGSAASILLDSAPGDDTPAEIGFNFKLGGPSSRGNSLAPQAPKAGLLAQVTTPPETGAPDQAGGSLTISSFPEPREEPRAPSDTELAAQVAAAVAKGGDARFVVLYQKIPNFPPKFEKSALVGAAKISFTISATGHPEEVREVSSNAPEFGAAAVEALKQWRFIPTIKNGKAVQTVVEIPFNFGSQKSK